MALTPSRLTSGQVFPTSSRYFILRLESSGVDTDYTVLYKYSDDLMRQTTCLLKRTLGQPPTSIRAKVSAKGAAQVVRPSIHTHTHATHTIRQSSIHGAASKGRVVLLFGGEGCSIEMGRHQHMDSPTTHPHPFVSGPPASGPCSAIEINTVPRSLVDVLLPFGKQRHSPSTDDGGGEGTRRWLARWQDWAHLASSEMMSPGSNLILVHKYNRVVANAIQLLQNQRFIMVQSFWFGFLAQDDPRISLLLLLHWQEGRHALPVTRRGGDELDPGCNHLDAIPASDASEMLRRSVGGTSSLLTTLLLLQVKVGQCVTILFLCVF